MINIYIYTHTHKYADIFNNTQVTFVRNIVWTLSNLCRNKNPPPPFEIVKTALPVLNRLLASTDRDILGEISHFFFYYITLLYYILQYVSQSTFRV